MESLENFNQKPEKGSKAAFWVAGILAALAVVAIVAYMMYAPTRQEVVQASIEGALREGNPEFDALTKKIVAENDVERTSESPTGLGTIQMSIWGKIRNLTGKRLTGLELQVSVIDLNSKSIRDKTVIVIPKQQPALDNYQTMPVQIIMDGFAKDDDRANIRWKVTAIKVE
jgi:hypothetical protein